MHVHGLALLHNSGPPNTPPLVRHVLAADAAADKAPAAQTQQVSQHGGVPTASVCVYTRTANMRVLSDMLQDQRVLFISCFHFFRLFF